MASANARLIVIIVSQNRRFFNRRQGNDAPVPLFEKTKGGYGCCTYRCGLSALFVLGGGHCEGLEHGTDEGKIPTLEPNIVKHQSDYQILILGIVW